MNIFILFLLLPVAMCTQHYGKSTNPNDEPFLPVHSQYSYNPSLVKYGIEQHQEQQPQATSQLSPEIYGYSNVGYGQNDYYPSNSRYIKSVSTPSTLSASSYYQSPYVSNNLSPFHQLNTFPSPYSSFPTNYGPNAQNFGILPYVNPGAYPNYYYNQPYYYPNYQAPYAPPFPRYPGRSLKNQNYKNNEGDNDSDDDDDEDNNDDKPVEKSKKSGNGVSRLRNAGREFNNNQYVDGSNFLISSSKDLDAESSTHRIPSPYNQVEQNFDVSTHTSSQPKTTYRLVSISEQPPPDVSPTNGYIKVHQLEQLMRQALAKLLAQNTVPKENLARIQQQISKQQNTKSSQPYITIPRSIAKTGLSYIINPTILNRVNSAQSSTNVGPYIPNQLLQTQATLDGNNQSYTQKLGTRVTLQQSPEIYISPSKISSEQSPSLEYADYDSSESITTKSQQNIDNYQTTIEPTHKTYLYSTYRPTQKTNLDDANFGNKQKISGKS